MALVYLGLGSNLGDREDNISKALDFLSRFTRVARVSSLYETEPVGYFDQPKFLNAACEIETGLGPLQLLVTLKGIETTMGRQLSFRNAPRTVDIDILFYNDLILNTPALQIPHPRLRERTFVLAPLAEINPQIVHPVLKKAVGELMENAIGKETVLLWKKRRKI